MKFKFITLTAFASFGLFLGSFSSGPTGSQGDLTSSPLSTSNCNQCHAQTASLSPNVVIGVQETATQTPVSNGEYIPGTVYTVSFTVTGAPANGGYGMQATALAQGMAPFQAGTFASASTGAKLTTSGGVQYLEHSQRSSTGVFTMQWTAPAAGTGNVEFYVSGMAVNGSGSGGDALAQATLALTEGVSTSIIKVANQLDYQVYPNPVTNNQITIEGIDGEAMVVLTDLAGRQVWSQQLTSNQMEIPTLPKGIYQLTAIQGKKVGTQQLIIQ
jgi:hypothetical protein